MHPAPGILLTSIALFAGTAQAVDVFRCEDSQGAVTLTDAPCAQDQSSSIISIRVREETGSGLRDAERAALKHMEASMAQRRSLRAAREIATAEANSVPASALPQDNREVVIVPARFPHRYPQRPVRPCKGCGHYVNRPPSGGRVHVPGVRRAPHVAPRHKAGYRAGVSAKIKF